MFSIDTTGLLKVLKGSIIAAVTAVSAYVLANQTDLGPLAPLVAGVITVASHFILVYVSPNESDK